MGLGRNVVFGVAALCGLVLAQAAQAQFSTVPVSKCNAGKVKVVGKTAARLLGCYRKGGPELAGCLAKEDGKFNPPTPGKGAFDKADLKDQACLAGTTGNQASYQVKLDAFASDVNVLLGVPATPTKCDAARLGCVRKYVAGMLGCVAKTAAKLGGTVDAACLAKQASKFSDPMTPACYDKATEACSNGTTATTAKAEADAFIEGAACQLLPGATPCIPVCGNGFVEPGESCDTPDDTVCGPNFSCTSCNCACPTRLHFVGDPTDPAGTLLDVGWTGFAHRSPLQTGSDLSLSLSCGPTTRPCGTCTVGGPIANPGAGELRNQRCSNDTSIQCSDDTPCTPGGGTCELFFGAPLPFSAGGVPMCVFHQFNGALSGTANVETGQAVMSASFLWQLWHTGSVDTPCPTCAGDPTPNDGLAEGSCTDGPRATLPCDGNASVPGRPDYGTTSFDCPPASGDLVGSSPFALAVGTETQTKTLTAASPPCTGFPGRRCFCDTCNNADREPCMSNADCPDPAGPIGPICGGRSCLAGSNLGAACTASSECPGSGCGRPGEPTKPNGCIDSYDSLQCVDEAPIGDDAGGCQNESGSGTKLRTCSNHPQRVCSNDGDCDGVPGACVVRPRPCFLDEGELGGQIIAAGMTDTPMGDVSAPSLASVFCLGPSQSPLANIVLGLPGPARMLMQGTVTAHP